MYYILFGLLYLVSLLPFFILYGIADVLFVLIYFVAGYRKEVVMDNLRNSFPDKTEKERRLLPAGFTAILLITGSRL